MNRLMALAALVVAIVPAIAAGGDTSGLRSYDSCITRYAAQGPSPQATAILQRACFYKYRLTREHIAVHGLSAEHKKLSKTYTPEVCDCVFAKMPDSSPNTPAALVLKQCVENSKKPRPTSPQ